MALVYLGIGVWLFWSAGKPMSGGLQQLGTTGRRVLGGVFFLYGLVRFVRGHKANFRKKTNLNDDE
ncbi:hypothetical protein GCM10022409_27530 [Hymenobacter glaciei]|uniref:Uncharacterized protein n=2 Tax=Hymenobacter glaciei TaxID=877209 RepID=A0ABP7UC91_9BACT